MPLAHLREWIDKALSGLLTGAQRVASFILVQAAYLMETWHSLFQVVHRHSGQVPAFPNLPLDVTVWRKRISPCMIEQIYFVFRY